jgi:glycosyltransferase involved in cell wall biosynthesis
VLFLTRYPVEGASSRYRVHQYVPFLEQQGISCTVQSFMDASMYRLSLSPGRTWRKLLATGLAVLRRMSALRRWKRYDVIYMQRELLPFGPPVLERWLKRSGAVLFFDLDDALFIKKASRYNPVATFFRSPEKTLDVFGLVDCTVAGNDWLRDAARAKGARAETIEVAEDTERVLPKAGEAYQRPVTIGWLGSPSTVKYLSLIAAPLRRIAQRHPSIQWEIMGGGGYDMEGVPWQHTVWGLQAERDALYRFDIGLMPLPPEDWAKGKSGGKARTYMAAGTVPVVAAVGYNLELITHGETGFLCRSNEDWEEAIEKLIADPALRSRVATAARQDVQRRFSQAGQAARLASLLREVVKDKRSRA